MSACNDNDCVICPLIKKYDKDNSDWMYIWFYDLKEWEDSGYDLSKNRAWFDLAHRFRLREAAEKVKKIRSKLGDLRTKMVLLPDILACLCISSDTKFLH
jgi:hypothetical protein